MNNYAPILIPTLNRYLHLKRCVESLSKCTYADKTELVIGLDYPPSPKYFEGYKLVKEYIPSISGFAKVTVIKQDKNIGASRNLSVLREYAASKYDRFIVSEDDNEFSPNFIDYINKGLNIYEKDERIYAICGYNYPIDMIGYENNIYFSHEFSAWGYGTWVKKREHVFNFIEDPAFLFNLIKEQPLISFFKNRMRLINAARQFGRGVIGDAFVTYYLHTYNMYSVFPKISKSRNWGHDGSGLHCSSKSISSVYASQYIDTNYTFDYDSNIPVIIDETINQRFLKYKMNSSFLTKVKKVILFMLIRIYTKIR